MCDILNVNDKWQLFCFLKFGWWWMLYGLWVLLSLLCACSSWRSGMSLISVLLRNKQFIEPDCLYCMSFVSYDKSYFHRRHFNKSPKITGVNLKMNDGWNGWLASVSERRLCAFWLAVMQRFVNVISNSCSFPSVPSQKLCGDKGPQYF